MGTKIATEIDLTGPFFTRDPKKTFRRNVREMMASVAELAEADVKAQLAQGEGSRKPMRGITPSRVSGHVIGRTRSLRGKPWAVTAVVSVNNSGFTKRQGTTLMAAASELEGRLKVFRRTTSRLRRASKVTVAELLKGLE